MVGAHNYKAYDILTEDSVCCMSAGQVFGEIEERLAWNVSNEMKPFYDQDIKILRRRQRKICEEILRNS